MNATAAVPVIKYSVVIISLGMSIHILKYSAARFHTAFSNVTIGPSEIVSLYSGSAGS